MSLWLPRSCPTVLARSSSRTIYYSRPHLILPSKLRSLGPTPLGAFTRYESTKPNPPATTSDAKASPPATKEAHPAPLSTRVWKKVKHEAQHYWHGTKLLVSEVRISSRLQWKILQGDTLTRRERRQVGSQLCFQPALSLNL